MREEEKKNKNKIFSERLMWLQAIFALLIAGFIIYLFCMQVLDVKEYRTKAKKQNFFNFFLLNLLDKFLVFLKILFNKKFAIFL